MSDAGEAPGPGGRVGTPFQRWLRLRWEQEADDSVAVVMEMRDDLRGPAESLEGGVVSALADVAAASAAATALGKPVATEHLAISFLAPGREGPIRATGTVLRSGRQDAVARYGSSTSAGTAG